MAKFTIPYNRVEYDLGSFVGDAKNFNTYWGATVNGDYGNNPYKLTITNVGLTFKIQFKNNSETAGYTGVVPASWNARIRISSHEGTSTSMYDSVWFNLGTISTSNTRLTPGSYANYTGGSWSGSNVLKLHPNGGKLRAYLTINGNDARMIWSSEYYPTDYVPVNPDLNVSFGSDNVNDIKVDYISSITTDLSSFTYTINIYSDPGRTQLVKQFHANNLNGFPLHWNGAIPGTTYYWSIDMSGVNNRTGGTVSMPTKTGTMTTMKPTIAKEAFTLVSASPLFNGHWTPRTIVKFKITDHGANDHSAGLTFKNFQVITALNGLNKNEKEYRISTNNSNTEHTLVLTDTSKLIRAVKPRDLFYLKIRTCCIDNAGREYFSDTIGVLTPQYIYNWFHVYLAQPSKSEQLRVNSKIAFSGKTSENYWNKGEVK